jgi:DNA polymerase-1
LSDKKKKTLVLLDSNALIHRAYHALPPLTNKEGQLTNAVYGYALTLFSVLEKIKPGYIVATFDLEGPTFRHEQYKEYKATRKKADDELYAQIPMVKEMLQAFNIPIYEKKGFEADDIIGTIVRDEKINDGIEKMIVTGDMDALQLVNENTKVFTLRKGITDTVIYDIERVKDRYNLSPIQIIDYKSLKGDPSDNIPGVKGVGDKTTTELLLEYETLDGIYENIDKIKETVRKKLELDKKNAYMSYELAQIKTDVPIDFKLEECEAKDYDKQKLVDFLRRMGFHTLISRHFPDYQMEDGSDGNRKAIKMSEVEILADEKSLSKVSKLFKKADRIGFSGLGSDENCFTSEFQGFGLAVQEKDEIRLFFAEKELFEVFMEILKETDLEIVGYNIKKDFQLLQKPLKEGVSEMFAKIFDVQIAAYLLNSGTNNELEKLIMEEFGQSLKHKTTKNGQASFLDDNVDNEKREVAEIAGWSLALFSPYSKKLQSIEKDQKKNDGKNKTILGILNSLETPLIRILANMEKAGIKVERQVLKSVSDLAQEEIEKLEKKIFEMAGDNFNINSPSQLADILYNKLKISTAGIRKGKTGFSTDAEQLKKLAGNHPIIAEIENYRELFKLKTTYADALPKLITEDGRIHAKFNQAVTATGRLSSSDPNLQNIPKRGKLAKEIRKAFVADKGKVLLALDYSQIDLRAAAHLSGDEKMIEIFQKGRDIHRSTAAWVNKIKEDEVIPEQRSEAKSLNFGVLYGMGVYGFMRDSGVSRDRANFFIEKYMETFSGLKDYLEKTKEFARKFGYVETELGRRRYIPNINNSNFQVKNAAERVAINLPVQGLSADIMKLAMIKVDEEISAGFSKKEIALVLQVHDELIFEVDEDKADEYEKKIKKVMEDVYKLKVPLVVESSVAGNWSEI